MAIGTLALCYNNIELFRGVVKMRRGKILKLPYLAFKIINCHDRLKYAGRHWIFVGLLFTDDHSIHFHVVLYCTHIAIEIIGDVDYLHCCVSYPRSHRESY